MTPETGPPRPNSPIEGEGTVRRPSKPRRREVMCVVVCERCDCDMTSQMCVECPQGAAQGGQLWKAKTEF
jgi:hypothetical protein